MVDKGSRIFPLLGFHFTKKKSFAWKARNVVIFDGKVWDVQHALLSTLSRAGYLALKMTLQGARVYFRWRIMGYSSRYSFSPWGILSHGVFPPRDFNEARHSGLNGQREVLSILTLMVMLYYSLDIVLSLSCSLGYARIFDVQNLLLIYI